MRRAHPLGVSRLAIHLRSLLLLAAATATLLIPVRVQAQPQAGVWEGPTCQQQPLTFSTDGTNVTNLQVKIVSNNTRIFDIAGPYAITSNAIETGIYTGADSCPTVDVTGTFSSSTSAPTNEGLVYFNLARHLPGPVGAALHREPEGPCSTW